MFLDIEDALRRASESNFRSIAVVDAFGLGQCLMVVKIMTTTPTRKRGDGYGEGEDSDPAAVAGTLSPQWTNVVE